MLLIDKIDKTKLPQHIAVIMDGNGRWAKQHHKPRVFGHKNGVKSVQSVVEGAAEIGIKYITLYAFSTENWKRPKLEVTALMQLLVNTISNEVNELHKNNIRLLTIGETTALPKDCYNALQTAIEKTKNNTGLSLVLALSYSARWEITEAIKNIAFDVQEKKIDVPSINQDTINQYLNTATIPDPELLIRTSGEHRVSNFLLWQIAYTEFYFTNKHWPDFRKEDFFEAIYDFQNRERRFGLVSEQINN